jgi:hypothetical protein
MKLEIVEHCFGQYVNVDGIDVCDTDDIYSKEELLEKRLLLIDELKDNILSINPNIYIEIANTLSSLDSFDNNVDESSSNICEQCGNWNSSQVYERKQALINMMEADEEFGLYDATSDAVNRQGEISEGDMPSIIDYEGPTKHDESEIEYVEWDHKKQSWEKSNK